jgi:hypothetical protein
MSRRKRTEYYFTVSLIFAAVEYRCAKRAPKNYGLVFAEPPIPSLYAKASMYEIGCPSYVNTKQGEDDFVFRFAGVS